MKKYIPNTISIVRIILSVAMIFLAKNKWIFIPVYCVTALTDKIDGTLARRWKVSSQLGAQLDSVGDAMIFFCGLASLGILFFAREETNFSWDFATIPMLGAYVCIKVAVLFLTRYESGRWYMLHTYLDKFLGLLLYISVPIVVAIGGVKSWWVGVIMFFCVVSAIEDAVYVCKAKEVDPDYKGLLFQKIT
jgi:CDP-diacylglycerol--glycerol-3-phosphate 3-phosphatidyltransferase